MVEISRNPEIELLPNHFRSALFETSRSGESHAHSGPGYHYVCHESQSQGEQLATPRFVTGFGAFLSGASLSFVGARMTVMG